MLNAGRINMTPHEAVGVDKIIEQHGAEATSVSICRALPGEKGPVQVELDGKCWHVDKAGKAKKVAV